MRVDALKTWLLCIWLAVAGWAQAAPARVVSLLPSLTETVCALGACDRLVGVDRYSNWPPSIKDLPRLGGGLDPNVEAIVALRPDLVLVAKSARVLPRLQSLGLHVAVLEPQSHADVLTVTQEVARLLALPSARADALWQVIQREIARAQHSMPARAKGQRIYFEVNDAPYAAGPSSFIGETLIQLGLNNVVPSSWPAFARINSEWVVAQQPDLILVGDVAASNLIKRPGWSSMRALQQQRLCAFKPEQADILVRAGPRMGQAAQLIVDCLRGLPTP